MALFGSFNSVTVMGTMTRDAEVRTLASGTRVANIGIAINDRTKKGDEWVEETTFVDVTLWQKNAEWAEKFGGKGKPVLIRGKLRQEKWQDKASGAERSKIVIVADEITFMPGGDRADNNQQRQDRTPARNRTRQEPPQMPYAKGVDDYEGGYDDGEASDADSPAWMNG